MVTIDCENSVLTLELSDIQCVKSVESWDETTEYNSVPGCASQNIQQKIPNYGWSEDMDFIG